MVAALTSSISSAGRARSAPSIPGAPTRAASPPSHERRIPMPAPPATPGLSTADRAALIAAVRTAPVVPSALLRDPAVAALADEARRALARGTGRRPDEVELDVRALSGAEGRVLLFRESSGRQMSLPAPPPADEQVRGIAAALAGWNVVAGVGLGYRVVPGVISSGAMATATHTAGRDELAAHLRVGASTTLGGAAYVWELDGRPRPVGPAFALAAPFVRSERDPQLGDKLELSIPGYVTFLAAVKRGEGDANDVGWLGVVWNQGLLGPGPGPTVNAKLVLGHPVLAAPLAPVVGGATAVLSPIMARLQQLQHRADARPQSS
jgi:hypothetical protein